METAVKMQTAASVRTQMTGRQVSLETSVKNGDFTKLLQAKKDMADAADQTGQTQTKKPDEDTVKKPSEANAEDTKTPVKDEEDLGQQEALQQAALLQAAAQVVEVPTEEPEAAAAETEALIQVTDVAMETGEETAAIQKETEPAFREAAPAAESTQSKEKPVTDQTQKPVTDQTQKPVTNEPRIQEKADTRGQEKDLAGSNERKSQSGPSVSGNQDSYGAAAFRVSGNSEHMFRDSGKVGEIPLKTTPQTLPEDLGRTLAARLPEAGRTLTVELEPASLGKLTIHMTYEAGRAAVSILATNPRTLELLNEKASEIAAILEEKTGQNTVILTQQPHEQEQYQENKDGAAGQGDGREQGRQEKEEKGQHSDSFAQQLRLGLV